MILSVPFLEDPKKAIERKILKKKELRERS
jgi:hypothetical protein